MQKIKSTRTGVVIAISFFCSFILTIFPLPTAVAWARPVWILLIVSFWLISAPHRVGIVIAFMIGVLMDLLTGTILGLNALLFTILAYLLLKFHMQLRGKSSGQKILVMMVITTIYLAIQYWFTARHNITYHTWKYWLPIFTTALCWPIVAFLLRDYHLRFKVSR